jgi:YfiH family protein
LRQVHGVQGVAIDIQTPANTEADLAWTRQIGVACTMMVADCLPILVCHPQQKWVASAHAGWRGLAGSQGLGVVESLASVIHTQGLSTQDCLVWLGPCIGPTAFEVGPEVLAAFQNDKDQDTSKSHFVPSVGGKYMADLAGLARSRLQMAGFQYLFGNDSTQAWCTFSQPNQYHSHRRDAALLGSAGRMAAYIWITA